MGGRGSLSLAGFLLLVLPGFLSAQSNTAQLIGRISDSSGGIIAGAEVVVVNEVQGFQRSVGSNEDGYYFCPILPDGIYRISVSVPGFQPNVRSGIRLGTQQTVRVDFILDLGKVSQVVEVVEPPLRLNTENGQLSDVRPRDDLLNLPVNDRSAIKFFFLTSFNYQGSGSSFSLGGLRGINTNFTIDGVSTNSALFGGQIGPMTESSLESVRELKVFSSNNSAEFPGVGTVMLSSRAGGNQLHGSAFFLTSNNALNARNPFSPANPEGPLAHEFGGSLGGPVVLPSIYDGHKKAFFYFSWEQQLHPGALLKTANVPTAKMRQGDFSELLPRTVILDPATGLPFSGNIIPTDRINPVSLNIQSFAFLPPNYGPANEFSANWRSTLPASETNNRYVIRVDHQINPSDLLSTRSSIRSIPLPVNYDADLPTFQHKQRRQTINVYLSETHAFSTKLLNEVRLAYSRDYSQTAGVHDGTTLVHQFGLQGIPLAGKENLTGVPNLQFVNFSRMNEYPSSYWMSETYEFLDDVHFSRGKHNLSMGVLFQRNRGNVTACCNSDFGTFSFDGFSTGFDYADFLLGLPQTSSRYDRSQPRYNRYSQSGLYIHEDYQLTPRFTFNLGLRYDYFSPPVDKYDMRFTFDPNTGSLILASAQSERLIKPDFPSTIPLVTAAEAGYPLRTLLDRHYTNFGPRLGFAGRLFHHTVLRGGYGVYYTRLAATLMERFSGGPFQINEEYQNQISGGGPQFQFPNPFPEGNLAQQQSISPASRNIPAPYTQQWNLTFEHEFPFSILARATYRGFLTARIPYVADINKPFPSENPAARDYFRYPNFSEVNLAQEGGIQKMNAMDISVERKFMNGLTFQSGWTWAKNLTDVGDDDETAAIENAYDRRREMANIFWTPRHRFVSQALYALPLTRQAAPDHGPRGLTRQLLEHWQISSIVVMQTGQFLTPTFSGSDPSNTRTQGGRPDQVGNPQLSNPTASLWFNPAAFVVPPNGRFGNSARGVAVGPGLVNLDFGLYRHFYIKEKMRLQLRVTATNVVNHPNYGNPNLDISSLNVGKITSLQGDRRDTLGAGPRTIQLGIRFDF